MNFLQICQKVKSLSGLSGTGPTATATATGIDAKIVSYVQDAWVAIQQLTDWKFLHATAPTNTLVVGSPRYTLTTALGMTSLARLDPCSLYLSYAGTRYRLDEASAAELEDLYVLDTPDNACPTAVAVNTATGEMIFNCPPDVAYSFAFRYYQTPELLQADADIPSVDEAHHKLIVWRALMDYGRYDGAPEVLQWATQEYDKALIAFSYKYANGVIIEPEPLA